jgi:RHS repeat-associated protein
VEKTASSKFIKEAPIDGWLRGNALVRAGARGSNYPFLTSKERDIETGLDYFGARYYASMQGRFITPDSLLSSGKPEEPSSWNRYVYTLNNPLT